jgi:hypothetical protein
MVSGFYFSDSHLSRFFSFVSVGIAVRLRGQWRALTRGEMEQEFGADKQELRTVSLEKPI